MHHKDVTDYLEKLVITITVTYQTETYTVANSFPDFDSSYETSQFLERIGYQLLTLKKQIRAKDDSLE